MKRALARTASASVKLNQEGDVHFDEISHPIWQVVIQGLTGSTLNALLDFIYTGIICVTQENVQELLIGSDMIQLQEVVDICTQFLIDQVAFYFYNRRRQ